MVFLLVLSLVSIYCLRSSFLTESKDTLGISILGQKRPDLHLLAFCNRTKKKKKKETLQANPPVVVNLVGIVDLLRVLRLEDSFTFIQQLSFYQTLFFPLSFHNCLLNISSFQSSCWFRIFHLQMDTNKGKLIFFKKKYI